MDIRKHAVKMTGRLPLKGADGNPMLTDDKKPVAVNVYGPGSKEYAAAQFRNQARMVEQFKTGSDGQTVDEKITATAEMLASITHSFENLEYDNLEGDALKLAVYSDRSIGFIADQVNKFAADWGNFK